MCMIDSAAASALFSLAAASNDLAWMTPIACRLFWGYENFNPGPFYLGSTLSKAVSAFAWLYLSFAKHYMNYTVVINVAVWAGSLCYYFFWAHRWFQGPKSNLELDAQERDVDGWIEEVGEELKQA